MGQLRSLSSLHRFLARYLPLSSPSHPHFHRLAMRFFSVPLSHLAATAVLALSLANLAHAMPIPRDVDGFVQDIGASHLVQRGRYEFRVVEQGFNEAAGVAHSTRAFYHAPSHEAEHSKRSELVGLVVPSNSARHSPPLKRSLPVMTEQTKRKREIEDSHAWKSPSVEE